MPDLPPPPDQTVAPPARPAGVSGAVAGFPLASAAVWFADLRARWATSPALAAVGGGLAVVVVAVIAWSAFTGGTAGAGPPIESTFPRADGSPSPSGSAGSRGTGDRTPGNSDAVGDDLNTAASSDRESGFVVVHVAGAVVRPGLYRLGGSPRIADAVDAAGGVASEADVDALNLAAPAVDGERIYVPRRGETPPAAFGTGSSPASGSSPEPLDLNTATAEQLEDLPGVGPATAEAIIEHREQHGRFRSVDELLEVRGIGQAKLDALRSKVRVR